jgi:hypothetical protein
VISRVPPHGRNDVEAGIFHAPPPLVPTVDVRRSDQARALVSRDDGWAIFSILYSCKGYVVPFFQILSAIC